MSETSAPATVFKRIGPFTYRWHVSDDRLGGTESDSYALDTKTGVLFFDPLPVTHAALERFPAVAFVYLTTARHARACWRYRREVGARIYAPRGARTLEYEPDFRYRGGDDLPGNVHAIHTPGPDPHHFAFLRVGEPTVMVVGDLVMRRDAEGPLELLPEEHLEDPVQTRASVERLLDYEFDYLLPAHGPPITEDPGSALRELLDRTP